MRPVQQASCSGPEESNETGGAMHHSLACGARPSCAGGMHSVKIWRLTVAKMKYDPNNLFRVNQNIAPASA